MSVPYWRLSNFYFCYFATLGSFLPYWNLFLKHEHFNAAQIGELSALMMATKVISPNVWGTIADRTGKRLKIIRLVALFTTLLFTGFFFKTGFVWFALITFGYSFFWNASLPQFEAATLFHLKQEPNRYSQIRLWGSVGFIVAVLGIGRFLDTHSISLLPVIMTALFASIWLAALFVPEIQIVNDETEVVSIFKILKRPEIIAFFVVYLLLQAAHGPYYVFYSIHLKQLHYSSTLIGELWALGVMAEIVLFLYMKKLLRVCSLRSLLLSSILFSIVRWSIIGFAADSLYWLIGAQLLHAATFGSAHVAAIHLIHQYFNHQHQGKGQALYASLSFGLGGMSGSLFSGYYWEELGATVVYLIAAVCCLLAFFIAYGWVGREKHVTQVS
jgi:MFS transporter, PPP family, 3-phenylpropionic acid transporter